MVPSTEGHLAFSKGHTESTLTAICVTPDFSSVGNASGPQIWESYSVRTP